MLNLNTNWVSTAIKTLKQLHPVIKSNFQAIQNAFNNHVLGSSDRHNSSHIDDQSTGLNQSQVNSSLQGQINSIQLADSNAQLGVYSLHATGTDDYSATYEGLEYFDKLKINLGVVNRNTGAASLTLNDGDTKSIKVKGTNGLKYDLTGGELYGVVPLEFDGEDLVLIGKSMKETTPRLTQFSNHFTLGTGKDEQGQDADYSAAIEEGQLTDVVVSGNTTNVTLGENFESGIGGFSSVSGTIAQSTTKKVSGSNSLALTISALNTSTRIAKSINHIVGDKYYLVGQIYPIYSNDTFFRLGNVVGNSISVIGNQWNKISDIITPVNSDELRLYHASDSSYLVDDVIYFDDIMAINLTEKYGEGNEPTKEWCDKNIHFMTTGTKSTLSVRGQILNENICPDDIDSYELGSIETVNGTNVVNTTTVRLKQKRLDKKICGITKGECGECQPVCGSRR